jgi:hypothetical protein
MIVRILRKVYRIFKPVKTTTTVQEIKFEDMPKDVQEYFISKGIKD